MDQAERIRTAESDLERTLSFFSRVDNKASTVFAIDVGMLALGCLNLKIQDLSTWYIGVPAALTVVLITVSLAFVYRAHFPHLSGDQTSLIYFQSIASLTEGVYLEKAQAVSDAERCRDLLSQIWRNAEILKIKFGAVRTAFALSLIALLPWVLFLLAASLTHTSGLVVK